MAIFGLCKDLDRCPEVIISIHCIHLICAFVLIASFKSSYHSSIASFMFCRLVCSSIHPLLICVISHLLSLRSLDQNSLERQLFFAVTSDCFSFPTNFLCPCFVAFSWLSLQNLDILSTYSHSPLTNIKHGSSSLPIHTCCISPHFVFHNYNPHLCNSSNYLTINNSLYW